MAIHVTLLSQKVQDSNGSRPCRCVEYTLKKCLGRWEGQVAKTCCSSAWGREGKTEFAKHGWAQMQQMNPNRLKVKTLIRALRLDDIDCFQPCSWCVAWLHASPLFFHFPSHSLSTSSAYVGSSWDQSLPLPAPRLAPAYLMTNLVGFRLWLDLLQVIHLH